MKKLLYGLFIFVISITYINVDAKTIYLQECEYTDEYKRWLKLSDEEKKEAIMPTVCKNDNHNRFVAVGNSASTLNGVSASDSKFNLKDYSLVTGVKDQGPTGTCWAFATNSSIESNLLMNGHGAYDLSEAHMELSLQNTVPYNRLTFNRKIDMGGNYFQSSAYLRNNWGSVHESTLPLNELVDMYNFNKDGSMEINQSKIVDESKVLNNKAVLDVNSIAFFGNSGKCSNDTIKEIKEYLITNGALATMVNFDNGGSFSLYQYYDGLAYKNLYGNIVSSNQNPNHAVTIVGWDDTISKDKFSNLGTPTSDGAFIIKNSYGVNYKINLMEYKQSLYNNNINYFNNKGIYSANEITDQMCINNLKDIYKLESNQIKIEEGNIVINVGNDGYQYVSYDDVLVCNSLTGFFDVDENVEDYVYGYDSLGYADEYFLKESNIGYFANFFDKKSDGNEQLEELNIYFPQVGQEYEIYFANGETKNIENAKLVAMGKSEFIGYSTIELENEIITSDRYSIIVKISDDELLRFAVSMNNNVSFYSTYEYTDNVQFLSTDGVVYAPANENGERNFVIKVYTNDTTEEPKDDSTKVDNDNTKDDGKIEILPNDKNQEIDKNENVSDESNVENPETGDMITYILIITFVIIGVGFISYRKLQRVKQNN